MVPAENDALLAREAPVRHISPGLFTSSSTAIVLDHLMGERLALALSIWQLAQLPPGGDYRSLQSARASRPQAWAGHDTLGVADISCSANGWGRASAFAADMPPRGPCAEIFQSTRRRLRPNAGICGIWVKMAALRFCYGTTLRRPEIATEIPMPRRPNRLGALFLASPRKRNRSLAAPASKFRRLRNPRAETRQRRCNGSHWPRCGRARRGIASVRRPITPIGCRSQ